MPTGDFIRFTSDANFIPIAVEPLNDGSDRFSLGINGDTVSSSVTPTLTTGSAYVTGDFVGTSGSCMSFPNMGRVNGGTGILSSCVLIDRALQSISIELWLFDAQVTPPADSAAWTISDADALHLVAVVPFSTYYASALNSVSVSSQTAIPYACADNDSQLYGCLVVRGTATFATGAPTVKLNALRD